MSTRKLWLVLLPDGSFKRPESKAKAYDICIANARAKYRLQIAERQRHPWRAQPGRHVAVSVDERDGLGWRLYERVDLSA